MTIKFNCTVPNQNYFSDDNILIIATTNSHIIDIFFYMDAHFFISIKPNGVSETRGRAEVCMYMGDWEKYHFQHRVRR